MTLSKSKNIEDSDLILPESLRPIENTFKVLKSVSRHAPKPKENHNAILSLLNNNSLQRVHG